MIIVWQIARCIYSQSGSSDRLAKLQPDAAGTLREHVYLIQTHTIPLCARQFLSACVQIQYSQFLWCPIPFYIHIGSRNISFPLRLQEPTRFEILMRFGIFIQQPLLPGGTGRSGKRTQSRNVGRCVACIRSGLRCIERQQKKQKAYPDKIRTFFHACIIADTLPSCKMP